MGGTVDRQKTEHPAFDHLTEGPGPPFVAYRVALQDGKTVFVPHLLTYFAESVSIVICRATVPSIGLNTRFTDMLLREGLPAEEVIRLWMMVRQKWIVSGRAQGTEAEAEVPCLVYHGSQS